MSSVEFLPIEGFAGNPAFSEIAIIPPQATLVWIGGQNAVSETREIVGKGDPIAQAQMVKRRIDRALETAGCSWDDVVRVQVVLVAGTNIAAVYEVFKPAFASRKTPPLVVASLVAALAHPDFLMEVGLEAVKPSR